MSPARSATPIPIIATSTSPSGANPVKFADRSDQHHVAQHLALEEAADHDVRARCRGASR